MLLKSVVIAAVSWFLTSDVLWINFIWLTCQIYSDVFIQANTVFLIHYLSHTVLWMLTESKDLSGSWVNSERVSEYILDGTIN